MLGACWRKVLICKPDMHKTQSAHSQTEWIVVIILVTTLATILVRIWWNSAKVINHWDQLVSWNSALKCSETVEHQKKIITLKQHTTNFNQMESVAKFLICNNPIKACYKPLQTWLQHARPPLGRRQVCRFMQKDLTNALHPKAGISTLNTQTLWKKYLAQEQSAFEASSSHS